MFLCDFMRIFLILRRMCFFDCVPIDSMLICFMASIYHTTQSFRWIVLYGCSGFMINVRRMLFLKWEAGIFKHNKEGLSDEI